MKENVMQKQDILFPYEKECNINDDIPFEYKICLAIPKSVKHILWFLSVCNENFLCFVEFDAKNNQLSSFLPDRMINNTFSILNETVALGSLIISSDKKREFFVIEDLCRFRGKDLYQKTFSEKLFYTKELLYLHEKNNSIQLVLPVFWKRDDKIPIIPYPFYVQYRPLDRIEPYLNIEEQEQQEKSIEEREKSTQYLQIFEIKSTLQSDIYNLYAYDKKKNPLFYDIAYIPNCKNSIYMNELFMEEETLDNLDDYMIDIVENRKIDIKKCIKMECVYYHRFKRWVPIRVVTDINCPITLIDILPLLD